MQRLFLASALFLAAALSLQGATVWSETDARIDEIVANAETKAPINQLQPLLAQTPFSNFRYPHVDANEDITFIADDPVYSEKVHHHGIYRSIAATGELRSLVRKGEAVVPGTSIRLDWFRGLQMDGSDLIFNATDQKGGRGLYYWSNGVLTMVARTGNTVLPGVHQPLSEVEWGSLDDGRILYNARAGQEDLIALYDLRSAQTRVLCRSGVDIPGRPGEQFRYFSHQNWIDGANVFFRGASVLRPSEPAPRWPRTSRPLLLGKCRLGETGPCF